MDENNIPDFRTIVEQHQDRVLNICYRFLRDREDARDTAQEVFMEVFRSLNAFKGEAALSTWIHRIAVTRSLDALRRKKRKKRISSARQILGLGEMTQEPADTAGNAPDAVLEEQEQREILQEAMDKLPETQRIALTLSQIEGFSYRETAEIMGTSLSGVESLVFRGKKNLKKHLTGIYKKITV